MIKVNNLTKKYQTPAKQAGFFGLIKDIINRQYQEIEAVKNITFTINKGELIGFVGPNGAGKTTTLKMLTGILSPTNGQIDVLGFTPFDKKPDYLKQIAFVAGQKNQLLWDLPAIDTFRLNKSIYDISHQQYNNNITKLTKLLDCYHLVNQPVKTLSLGERMKMELIASLLHNPKVLFLDEPTIGLDIMAQKIIRDFIKDYQKLTGATIILTSHYMEDIKSLCKKVMIINKGKIIYDGDLEKLIKKYSPKKTIEIIVEDMPDIKTLEKIDLKAKMEYPKLIFKVSQKKLPQQLEKITKNLEFSDLNIYEERIEDVIRKIFNPD